MKNLLLLVHRIPYPPNKGDKIRSYHLLEYLAQRYRVHLATFVDDEDDWQHVDRLAPLCVDTCYIRLNPFWARIRSLTGLLGASPLTLPYYRDAKLGAWVDAKLRGGGIDRVMVFSSSMAQYVEGHDLAQSRCLVDFVDVDSDKWRQYAEGQCFPSNWVYKREARTLLRYEQDVARRTDASLFVSKAEADLFASLVSGVGDKVGYYGNGVDIDYFSPQYRGSNPYREDESVMVFVGAMDYWANVDAVSWFAHEVFPQLLQNNPNRRFYIVGARPTDAVQTLAKLAGVEVTGTVPDVRPYVAHASLSVAPLRIARGIQNKVLEAMAMGRAVVASPAACEGIESDSGTDLMVADSVAEWITTIDQLEGAEDEIKRLGRNAREKILSTYTWEQNLQRLDALLEPGRDQTKSPGRIDRRG